MGVTDLLRGFPDKPPHPPLTDASIGAYTVGAAMLVLGALGIEESQMAHGALLAISGGLVLAAPTALTGLVDWLALPRGAAVRKVATIHLFTMVAATVLFALTWLAHLDGYDEGEVRTSAVVLGIVALGVLAVGGYVGGSLTFVYGVRVLGRTDASPTDALVPGRVAASSNDGSDRRHPPSPRASTEPEGEAS